MPFNRYRERERQGMRISAGIKLLMSMLFTALFLALALIPQGSKAQIADRPNRVQVELLASAAAVRPGDTVTIGLRQIIAPGWHTYWSNPGDSGEPTRIAWSLPGGASAGPIQWPLPHAIPVGPLTNYGYSEEVTLLSDIKVPPDAAGPSFDIKAEAKWLVCEQICIPEEKTVSLSLPLIGAGLTPRPSPHMSAIDAARAKIPSPAPWHAAFSAGADKVTLKIAGAGGKIPAGSDVHFFPLDWGKINHAAPQKAAFQNGDLILTMAPGEAPDTLRSGPFGGVLAVEPKGGGAGGRQGYGIVASLSETPIAPAPAATPTAGDVSGGISFLLAAGFAFLGGLILNLMPCVFPVLSLKALSLAKDAGDARTRRLKGVIYLAGVLASFAVIGAALAALRAAGAGIGWGMQFQSPVFVLAMMALFLALGLNLSGVFNIGGNIAGMGDSLTRRPGVIGYFFTGVLATAVATPCTAPFMGTAMGYAFGQPLHVMFAVLLALGFGFALPIVLLSLSPALGRLLPKPGAWMETFKQLMAFPLYATVGWLLWVLSVQQGSDGVVAGSITLIGVAFAVWLLGRGAEGGALRTASAALVAIAAIVLGASALTATPTQIPGGAAAESKGGPKAQPFTQAALDSLLDQRKPVFVNLTAAWCITCKLNERMALRSDAVAAAFEERGISYLVGDWTNGDPEITALLKAHGRVGVPLYLLYSGQPGAQPEILPQILTESIVIGRLAAIASPLQQAKKGD
jgi:thiol:disulfide interchange protein DsbD